MGRKNARRTGARWYKFYKQLIGEGELKCFGCGRRKVPLRFGHIKSVKLGGEHTAENLTVVCRICDNKMGGEDWTGKYPSILDHLKINYPHFFEAWFNQNDHPAA